MATKNTRNARLLLGATFAASDMKIVTKTHGLKLSLGIDFSKDTGHGDLFESYLPGIADFKVDIERWYDSSYNTMIDAVTARTKLCFAIYPDYADTAQYWAGTCYLNLKDQDLSLGNTAKDSFELVNGGNSAWYHTP